MLSWGSPLIVFCLSDCNLCDVAVTLMFHFLFSCGCCFGFCPENRFVFPLNFVPPRLNYHSDRNRAIETENEHLNCAIKSEKFALEIQT